jgi:multidrug resistance efflux pump
MKKPLIALILLIALVAGAVALVKLRQARNAAEPLPIIPPVTVASRTLTLEAVILTRPAVAEVRARTEAVVASRLSGYVLDMPKVEGQPVKQGETLARLDATQAEADLARGVAELTRSRQQEATLKAELASARAALVVEEQRFQRLQSLYRDKNVSLEQVQAEEAALSATRAKVASAESAWNAYQDALRAAESGLRAARKSPLRGTQRAVRRRDRGAAGATRRSGDPRQAAVSAGLDGRKPPAGRSAAWRQRARPATEWRAAAARRLAGSHRAGSPAL